MNEYQNFSGNPVDGKRMEVEFSHLAHQAEEIMEIYQSQREIIENQGIYIAALEERLAMYDEVNAWVSHPE